MGSIPGQDFMSSLRAYLFEKKIRGVVKRYNKNLNKGDLGIHLHEETPTPNLQLVAGDLKETSTKWESPILRWEVEGSRIILYLSRKELMCAVILKVLNHSLCSGLHTEEEEESGVKECTDLTELRSLLLKNYFHNLRNVLKKNKEERRKRRMLIRNLMEKESSKNKDEQSSSSEGEVKVAPVLDSRTGRKVSDTLQKYYSSVYEDLLDKQKEENEELNHALADAAIKFKMLSVSPNNPIKICSSDTHKGGVFILYNMARVSSLLHMYERLVASSSLPSLPTQPDCSLLTEPEEWTLCWCYLAIYVEILEESLQHPQKLPLYLSFLTQELSRYYRRVRILTEGNGPRQVSVLCSRVFLLKALLKVMHNCLSLLDISPIDVM